MTRHDPPASPLLTHCPETLPARAYYDADWFGREERAIWRRNWVYAGRLADLAPGTMRRISIGGQNLLLCRDQAGAGHHQRLLHRNAGHVGEHHRGL